MQWTTTIQAALGVLALCALTACGGDREQAETGPRTYSGTLSDGRAIYAALHDSGEYSITYSAANEPSKIAGVIQGHSTAIDGTFEAQDSHHFNFEENGQGKVSIVGTHVPNQSFEGTLQHAGAAQQHSFTSTASVGHDPFPAGDILKLDPSVNYVGSYGGQQVVLSPGADNFPYQRLSITVGEYCIPIKGFIMPARQKLAISLYFPPSTCLLGDNVNGTAILQPTQELHVTLGAIEVVLHPKRK